MKPLQNIFDNLYDSTSYSNAKTLASYYNFLHKNPKSIITYFKKLWHYCDEPQFYLYHADIRVNKPKELKKIFGIVGHGYSFSSEDIAALKCITEAFERYSNYIPRKKVVNKSIKEIDSRMLDPRIVTSYSKRQKEKYPIFRINDTSQFGWIDGWDLIKSQHVWIPAQLCYLNYSKLKNEPTILIPISTGVAGHSNISECISNGICEIVERDSFMIMYLNNIPGKNIDLASHRRLRKYQAIANRYKLDLKLIDISTDLGIYSFSSIVIDRTGIGVAVSVGLGSGLNPINAMCHAIEESFHPRSWIRSEKASSTKKPTSNIRNIVQRGLFWSDVKRIKNIEFLYSDMRMYNASDYIDKSVPTSATYLRKLIKILKRNNLTVFASDITAPEIISSGVCVIKTIIPELQPLFLTQQYPCFGGTRLYAVPVKLKLRKKKLTERQLNPVPHPFL